MDIEQAILSKRYNFMINGSDRLLRKSRSYKTRFIINLDLIDEKHNKILKNNNNNKYKKVIKWIPELKSINHESQILKKTTNLFGSKLSHRIIPSTNPANVKGKYIENNNNNNDESTKDNIDHDDNYDKNRNTSESLNHYTPLSTSSPQSHRHYHIQSTLISYKNNNIVDDKFLSKPLINAKNLDYLKYVMISNVIERINSMRFIYIPRAIRSLSHINMLKLKLIIDYEDLKNIRILLRDKTCLRHISLDITWDKQGTSDVDHLDELKCLTDLKYLKIKIPDMSTKFAMSIWRAISTIKTLQTLKILLCSNDIKITDEYSRDLMTYIGSLTYIKSLTLYLKGLGDYELMAISPWFINLINLEYFCVVIENINVFQPIKEFGLKLIGLYMSKMTMLKKFKLQIKHSLFILSEAGIDVLAKSIKTLRKLQSLDLLLCRDNIKGYDLSFIKHYLENKFHDDPNLRNLIINIKFLD